MWKEVEWADKVTMVVTQILVAPKEAVKESWLRPRLFLKNW